MKIRKNKPKYKQVSLQEMMAEITNNPMPKSNATRSIEDYIYVLGIIRRYGLNYVIDKVKDKFELSNFVLALFEYGISFNDYLVTSSILSVYPNIRYDNDNDNDNFKNMYSGKLNGNQINRIQEIVNKISYISTWLNNLNFNQNTHINKPKTTPELQNSLDIIKPIPNDITDSYGQKIDSFVKSIYSDKKHLTPDVIRKILNEWIAQEYNPTHFLTIQLLDNQKTKDLYTSINHLRNIMKTFEKSLMNNWNRHHLRFIAFAENGTSRDWHFHILFNQRNFIEEELQNAILKANIREQLPSYCLELKQIQNNLLEVVSYCTKEIKIHWNKKINCKSIIFSEDLFNLNK